MLIRILKQIDDSLDQVLICDDSDMVLGSLHIDAFSGTMEDQDVSIHNRLFRGESVRVAIVEADDERI